MKNFISCSKIKNPHTIAWNILGDFLLGNRKHLNCVFPDEDRARQILAELKHILICFPNTLSPNIELASNIEIDVNNTYLPFSFLLKRKIQND